MTKSKKIINYYQQNANNFGWGIDQKIPVSKIKNILPFIKGKKILEVGCGPGHLVNFLCKNGFDAYGVDICPEFIKFAQQNYSGKFILSDVSKLPFRKKEFDTVLLLNILEHLNNDLILKKITTIAKYIIISVPQSTPSVLKNRGIIYSHYQDKSHLRTYTPKSLKKLIHKSGGQIIKIIPIERMHSKSIFSELFQCPKLLKKIIVKIFFVIFKEKNYYLELLAIIKT